jgi:hypothetical protein
MTLTLLNSRTIFQHMHYKLPISYVIIYVLIKKRPTNTNKLVLQELPFSIALHIENILSFWVRTKTNFFHYIIIDNYYVNMNLFTIIILVEFSITKKIEKKMFDTIVCIVHYTIYKYIVYLKKKSKENKMQMELLFLIMRFLNWH